MNIQFSLGVLERIQTVKISDFQEFRSWLWDLGIVGDYPSKKVIEHWSDVFEEITNQDFSPLCCSNERLNGLSMIIIYGLVHE